MTSQKLLITIPPGPEEYVLFVTIVRRADGRALDSYAAPLESLAIGSAAISGLRKALEEPNPDLARRAAGTP